MGFASASITTLQKNSHASLKHAPPSDEEIAHGQSKDKPLQKKLKESHETCKLAPCHFSDKTHDVVTGEIKICLPNCLQRKC